MKRIKKEVLYACFGLGVVLAAGSILADTKKAKNAAVNEAVAKTIPINEKTNLVDQDEIPCEVRLSEDESGIFFGRASNEQPGYIGKAANKDGHVLVVGSSGAGKTSAIANPTAQKWQGASVTLLIKGNHKERVRRLEEEGHCVWVFDPASLEENKIRYDPFRVLDCFPEDMINNAKSIAETLIPMPERTSDPVWIHAAQSFLTGAILCFHSLGCSFIETMNIIMTKGIEDLVETIMESGNTDAISFVSQLASVDRKLLRNTKFELVSLAGFKSPQICTAFTEDPNCLTLDWTDLNRSSIPIDIIIVIPENRLEAWKPMLTLMLDQLIVALMARPERTYGADELPPLLVSIDEFPRLNKMPSILSGLTTLRSRGVTFLLLIQSQASLELLYGEQASRVIMENCTYKAILRVTEPKGQEYFSALVGETAMLDTSFSRNVSAGATLFTGVNVGESKGVSYTTHRRPKIYPQALSTLDHVICITPFCVCQAEKVPSYNC